MSEKITPKQLSEISIEAGTYELSATALSEGLLESDYSNEETYVRGEALIYEISPTGDYYIVTGYNPSELVNVVIPSEYNDGIHGTLPVREIGIRAFSQSIIEKVEIPNTIRVVGQSAFYYCQYLKEVVFKPRTQVTVYFRSDWNNVLCYYDLAGLPIRVSTYNVGNGIYKATVSSGNPKVYFTGSMNGMAFTTETFYPWHGSCWYANGAMDGNGNYLVDIYQDYTSPELENDYCVIDQGAFAYSMIEEPLIIPNTIGVIGSDAFAWCYTLKKVEMPSNSGTRIIEQRAFSNCYSLSTFFITNTVETIEYQAFMNAAKYDEDYFYFRRYSKSFSNRVKTIGSEAFLNCDRLLFGDPKSLIGGYVYDENMFPMLETIGDRAFKGCVNTAYDPDVSFYETFKFPKTMREIGIDVFKGCTALSIVEFENPYGWYFDNDTRVFIDKSVFSDSSWLAQMMISGAGGASGTTSSEPANAFNYPWYKIFQMIAPTISIEHNTTMNIKDSTGIAERFKIYARKEGSETRVEVAIVNAVSEADFE